MDGLDQRHLSVVSGGTGRHSSETRQLVRIEQIVDRLADGSQHAIERGQFQPTLAVQEIGNVRLREPGPARKFHARQLARINPLAQFLAQALLQGHESHRRRAYNEELIITRRDQWKSNRHPARQSGGHIPFGAKMDRGLPALKII